MENVIGNTFTSYGRKPFRMALGRRKEGKNSNLVGVNQTHRWSIKLNGLTFSYPQNYMIVE